MKTTHSTFLNSSHLTNVSNKISNNSLIKIKEKLGHTHHEGKENDRMNGVITTIQLKSCLELKTLTFSSCHEVHTINFPLNFIVSSILSDYGSIKKYSQIFGQMIAVVL